MLELLVTILMITLLVAVGYAYCHALSLQKIMKTYLSMTSDLIEACTLINKKLKEQEEKIDLVEKAAGIRRNRIKVEE